MLFRHANHFLLSTSEVPITKPIMFSGLDMDVDLLSTGDPFIIRNYFIHTQKCKSYNLAIVNYL